jgi:hypothetical protein
MFKVLGVALLMGGILMAAVLLMNKAPQPVVGLGLLVAFGGGFPWILYDIALTGELRSKGFVIRRETSPHLFQFFYAFNWIVCAGLLTLTLWACYLGPAGLAPAIDLQELFKRRPRQRAEHVNEPRHLPSLPGSGQLTMRGRVQ